MISYTWSLDSTERQKANRILAHIAAWVVIIHIAALCYVSFAKEAIAIKNRTEKKLIVKTVDLHPSQVVAKVMSNEINKENRVEVVAKKIEEVPSENIQESKSVEMPKEEKKEIKKTVVEKVPETEKPKPIKKKQDKVKKTEIKKKKTEIQKKVEVKKTTPVSKKTEEKSKKSEKKAAAKKIELPKENADSVKRNALLENAKQSLSKLHSKESAKDTLPSTIALGQVPTQIGSLHAETFYNDSGTQLNAQEVGYYDELASRLKLLLRLPEFGEVKIKLTLERSGKFINVAVVNTESANNRKYIEKTLPTLNYPAFGNNFSDMPQYTFGIALSNEF